VQAAGIQQIYRFGYYYGRMYSESGYIRERKEMSTKLQAWNIGDIKVEKPVIQGGMGIGISLSHLAGAVAKEGGVGIISAAQIGFREPDFGENTLAANLRAIRQELKKAREIAPGGVLGFNMMVAMRHYEEYVKEAVKAGADLIISGAGLPTELPAFVEGAKTKIAPIVSSVKSAKTILRYWDRKYSCTADLVVIEGPKAGGHLGFTREQLDKWNHADYGQEVREIIETVHAYAVKFGRKIPVALAGGISDARDVERAEKLGVDAVQVASRFVTTEECDADTRYKEAYLKAEKEDILIVKSPVGMPGRAIKNTFIERIMNGEKKTPKRCWGCLRTCSPAETPYCITEALINAALGNIEEALLFCGAEAYKAKKIETVKEVIDSLTACCV